MPYCELETAKLYYTVLGADEATSTKPSLVVAHGGPGIDHSYEIDFYQDLSKQALIYLYDHRGNGKSTGLNPSCWNLEQWANDLHDFCEILEIKHPIVCGDSFGGQVVMLYGALYPHHSQGLVLIGTEATSDVKEHTQAFEKKGGEKAKAVFLRCIEKGDIVSFLNDLYPLCVNSGLSKSYFGQCQFKPEVSSHFHLNPKPDLYSFLPKIQAPVLYITSDDNPAHLADSARKTADYFTSTTMDFHCLENCGYIALDGKKRAQQLILEFIQKRKF